MARTTEHCHLCCGILPIFEETRDDSIHKETTGNNTSGLSIVY
jgi:hypothetical protein